MPQWPGGLNQLLFLFVEQYFFVGCYFNIFWFCKLYILNRGEKNGWMFLIDSNWKWPICTGWFVKHRMQKRPIQVVTEQNVLQNDGLNPEIQSKNVRELIARWLRVPSKMESQTTDPDLIKSRKFKFNIYSMNQNMKN